MNYNNKFEKAIRKHLEQERKAQLSLLVKANRLELPIDNECNLCEKRVFSIMLWNMGGLNLRICKEYFIGFFFKILHLRPSTPSCMVYGEVGKLPLQITINKRLMSFWLRLLNKEESSLAHIVYMIAHNLFVRDVYKAKWLCRVNKIVDNCLFVFFRRRFIDINKQYTQDSRKERHKEHSENNNEERKRDKPEAVVVYRYVKLSGIDLIE